MYIWYKSLDLNLIGAEISKSHSNPFLLHPLNISTRLLSMSLDIGSKVCTMSEGESSTLPNGRESLSPAPTSAIIPPEIESTLSRLSAYRAVKGVMILSRSPIVSSSTSTPESGGGIVQCTGSIFEGEGGQRYARLVEGLVSGATKGVGECDEGVSLPVTIGL